MKTILPALHIVHRFKSRHSPCHGVCGISIFRSGNDLAVVVVSGMRSNTGMSVSSGFEHIATSVKDRFLADVPAAQILWVERHTAAAAHRTHENTPAHAETFDLVTLTAAEGEYTAPAWAPLGERSQADFWHILFLSDRPLSTFPDFDTLDTVS